MHEGEGAQGGGGGRGDVNASGTSGAKGDGDDVEGDGKSTAAGSGMSGGSSRKLFAEVDIPIHTLNKQFNIYPILD